MKEITSIEDFIDEDRIDNEYIIMRDTRSRHRNYDHLCVIREYAPTQRRISLRKIGTENIYLIAYNKNGEMHVEGHYPDSFKFFHHSKFIRTSIKELVAL